mmetsp:Transcript_26556/g.64193  ORF Transcript_26556/g.64193 Transcript_26556/m.64193 type:complete len:250 (-) Transcript_26556:4390-5139(-)
MRLPSTMSDAFSWAAFASSSNRGFVRPFHSAYAFGAGFSRLTNTAASPTGLPSVSPAVASERISISSSLMRLGSLNVRFTSAPRLAMYGILPWRTRTFRGPFCAFGTPPLQETSSRPTTSLGPKGSPRPLRLSPFPSSQTTSMPPVLPSEIGFGSSIAVVFDSPRWRLAPILLASWARGRRVFASFHSSGRALWWRSRTGRTRTRIWAWETLGVSALSIARACLRFCLLSAPWMCERISMSSLSFGSAL